MAEGNPIRRLAAILVADVVGYSRLVKVDEEGTVAIIRRLTRHVIDPVARRHSGRIVKTMGDGFLLEFASALEAVRAAIEISGTIDETQTKDPAFSGLTLRMGVHVGDILATPHDLMGDGVNIAARIETLARPGEIWISADTHSQVRGKLDVEFENLGQHQAKNMPEPLHVFRVAGGGGNTINASPSHEPSSDLVVVVPLAFVGADPEGHSLAESITKDITTGLARFRDLRVISPGSSFQYRDQNASVRQIAQDLNAALAIEGNLRKSGDRLRLDVSLVDATTGECLWSDRFDQQGDDLFKAQDDLVSSAVQILASRIDKTLRNRVLQGADTEKSGSTPDLIQRARAVILDTPEALEKCRKLYERAVAQDPRSALALAGLAGTYSMEWTSTWSTSRHDTLDKALDLLRRAAILDDQSSEIQRRLGVLHVFRGEPEQAESHLDRALRLNPNDAAAMAYKGLHLVYRGKPQEALAELDRATRCNPFHPTYFLWFAGLAHFMSDEFEEAIPKLTRAVELYPGFVTPHRHLAACYARMGEWNKADFERRAVLSLEPGFTISGIAQTFQYVDPADKARYCEALKLAGLPE